MTCQIFINYTATGEQEILLVSRLTDLLMDLLMRVSKVKLIVVDNLRDGHLQMAIERVELGAYR